MTTAYNQLKASVPGLLATLAEFEQSITTASLADRESCLSLVQSEGLNAYHAQFVAALNASASQAKNRRAGAFFVQVGSAFNWAVAGLYLGIVACVVAGPVGGAIVAAALACEAAGIATS